MEKKIAIIKNWIEDVASDDDLIQIVNEVNSYNGHLEEYCCYAIEMLNDFFCDTKPTDLLQNLARGFDINTDYFKFSIYGVESTSIEDMADEIRDYSDDIAEAIAEAMEETDFYLPSSLEEELAEEE